MCYIIINCQSDVGEVQYVYDIIFLTTLKQSMLISTVASTKKKIYSTFLVVQEKKEIADNVKFDKSKKKTKKQKIELCRWRKRKKNG